MRRALAALALAVVLPLPVLAQVTVRPGETLGEIAERYGVSVNRLMQANGIKDPTLVQIGQRLVIPGRAAARRSGAGGGGGTPRTGSHTVNSGETLGEIAERYDTSVNRLMQANGIKDPTLVQIGQRLVIPVRAAASRSGAGGGGGTARTGSYTVNSGETLGEIAERYNTSVNRLMQLNGISDPNLLQAGSRIQVPGAAPPARTAQARNGKAREHVVQPGESLSEIADTYNLPVQKLVSLNNISDPNLLMSGTRLKLTAPPPVLASRPAPKPPRPAAAKPKPKPVAKPATAVAAKPKPATATATAPAASPAPATPASATGTSPAMTPTPQATKPVDTKPVDTTAPVAARPTPRPASRPSTTATATAVAAKPAGPEWRTYGPLQVDWANWQPMGGSYVAPSLNAEGQPLYTAINCGARKINATSQTGQWRTWEAPRTDAEQQLVSDLCKAKGS